MIRSDLMIQVRPVSDLRNKFPDIEKIVNNGEMAEMDTRRMSHEEIFGSLRRKIDAQ